MPGRHPGGIVTENSSSGIRESMEEAIVVDVMVKVESLSSQ